MTGSFEKRKGRLIVVDGVKWKWRVGKRCGTVAYSEHGERRLTHASIIKGISYDTFDRGQWKGTMDGMITPADIAEWLKE